MVLGSLWLCWAANIADRFIIRGTFFLSMTPLPEPPTAVLGPILSSPLASPGACLHVLGG